MLLLLIFEVEDEEEDEEEGGGFKGGSKGGSGAPTKGGFKGGSWLFGLPPLEPCSAPFGPCSAPLSPPAALTQRNLSSLTMRREKITPSVVLLETPKRSISCRSFLYSASGRRANRAIWTSSIGTPLSSKCP